MKLLKSLKGSYDAVLVLLIVLVAAILLYAIYRAVGGAGTGARVSFAAAFDDVTGVKEKSKVLFKGMPVGSVGGLKYEPASDKILVRIDLTSELEIPSNVEPFLESSLFGESHISLRTKPFTGDSSTLASLATENSRNIENLYRMTGVRLSRADSIMPGLDANAKRAVDAAADAMVEVKSMAAYSGDMLKAINKDMDTVVLSPLKDTMQELKNIIAGPEGQADAGLAADLKSVVEDLEASTSSMKVLFNGSDDGSKKGLVDLTQEIDGGWQQVVGTLLEGKQETMKEMKKVSAALDKASSAISRSEGEIKKLGSASDKVGEASDRVEVFMDMLLLKPNAMVWGKSDQQKEMIQQRLGTSKARGATQAPRPAAPLPRK